ncbi:hypothetical protein CPF_2879 [Clostridium perfringens ATCC 13124]|uniref:Uncharacterized protein n=2 Tax=Clostridium perfringens TaxID=1502 RepID=B1UZT7_CLOPF|nr:hypothetical protein CPF_2879 [Clostridium perfringens ATCC 13124]AOY55340.1 hypothetical protein FORC25_2929 [Clostridium perfringens]EDT72929.1 hypothetical protein CJD_3197 [Clostridium perfringens D str. JGS1721]
MKTVSRGVKINIVKKQQKYIRIYSTCVRVFGVKHEKKI